MSLVTTSLVITMESSERVSNQRFLIYLFIYLFCICDRNCWLLAYLFIITGFEYSGKPDLVNYR